MYRGTERMSTNNYNVPVSPVSPSNGHTGFIGMESPEYVSSEHDSDVEEVVVKPLVNKKWVRDKPHTKFPKTESQNPSQMLGPATGEFSFPPREEGEENTISALLERGSLERKYILMPGQRTKRATSLVWKFFYIDARARSRAVCTLCRKSVSRGKEGTNLGTSTLRRHLQYVHTSVWDKATGAATNTVEKEKEQLKVMRTSDIEIESVDVSFPSSCGNDLNITSYLTPQKHNTESTAVLPMSQSTPVPFLTPVSKGTLGKRKATVALPGTEQFPLQQTLERKSKYSHYHPVVQEINRAVAEMVALDLLPFSFVSNGGFKRLMEVVTPKYQSGERMSTVVNNEPASLAFPSNNFDRVKSPEYVSTSEHDTDVEQELVEKPLEEVKEVRDSKSHKMYLKEELQTSVPKIVPAAVEFFVPPKNEDGFTLSHFSESNTIEPEYIIMPGQKTKRATSLVWNFFYIDARARSRAVCTLCRKSVSRGREGTHLGTSTLRRHLQSVHALIWAKATGAAVGAVEELEQFETVGRGDPDVEPVDTSLASLHGNDLNITSRFGPQKHTSDPAIVLPTSQSTPVSSPTPVFKKEVDEGEASTMLPVSEHLPLQQTLDKKSTYTHYHPVVQEINRAVAEMIALDLLPYSFGSTDGFKRLMEVAAPKDCDTEKSAASAFNVPVTPVSPSSSHSSICSVESLENAISERNSDSDDVEEEVGKKKETLGKLHRNYPKVKSFKSAPEGIPAGGDVSDSPGEEGEREMINGIDEGSSLKRVLMPGQKTKRATSLVWNFFYIDEHARSRAVCTLCNKSVSRGKEGTHLGTSTLRRHLQYVHTLVWTKATGTATGAVEEELEQLEAMGRGDAEMESMDVSFPSPRGSDVNISSCFASKRHSSDSATVLSASQNTTMFSSTLVSKGLLGKRKSSTVLPGTRQLVIQQTVENKSKYTQNHPVAQEINRAVAEMIALDLLPFSFVSNGGFKRLMEVVAPRYQIPSRTYFSTKALPNLYSALRARLNQALKEAQNRKVHLTTDMWTSGQTTDYMTLTAHWVTFKLGPSAAPSVNTSTLRKQAALCITGFDKDHTADDILEELNKKIGSWLTPKSLSTGFIVSGNEANVMYAISEGGFAHIPSFAHCLNLLMHDFLSDDRNVQSMLVVVRKICSLFSHSVKARKSLRELQQANNLPQHQLRQEIPSQWSSTFYMLSRLLEQKKAVHDFTMKNSVSTCDGLVLTPCQWELIENLCTILGPFESATQDVNADTACLSQILPLIHWLTMTLGKIRKDFEYKGNSVGVGLVDSLCLKMKKDLRFCNMLESEHYILATLLDPKFKCNIEAFLPEGTDLPTYKDILIDKVSDLMSESRKQTRSAFVEEETELVGRNLEKSRQQMVKLQTLVRPDTSITHPRPGCSTSSTDTPTVEEDSLWGMLEKYGLALTDEEQEAVDFSAEKMVEEYFKDKLPISLQDEPLNYWYERRTLWPALTQVAIQYLSCPPSSVYSERMFSAAEAIVTDRGIAQSTENVERLTFIKMNLKNFQYEYSTKLSCEVNEVDAFDDDNDYD
ncbi:zinc finger BED domain-containing protein 6 [Latimeria chalumnae]|uniref:zinc finger BED domain-containing protein 6 n=1 Tax=Latimeria chalumnae TaxID=7897 RepID=UPI0003C19C7B|nr:PREDICTED: zinc finger BED domain-containing protein 6-like [Latimeria chalumnae]|eukprot:XP_005986354.1 PREDICTED: zinc finger BED domain-containing protein 6-like [Latimeria chalumnae]